MNQVKEENKKEVLERIVHNQLNLPQNQNLFQGNVPRKITLDQSVYGEEEVINKKRDDNEIPRKISKVKEDQVFLIKVLLLELTRLI